VKLRGPHHGGASLSGGGRGGHLQPRLAIVDEKRECESVLNELAKRLRVADQLVRRNGLHRSVLGLQQLGHPDNGVIRLLLQRAVGIHSFDVGELAFKHTDTKYAWLTQVDNLRTAKPRKIGSPEIMSLQVLQHVYYKYIVSLMAWRNSENTHTNSDPVIFSDV